MFSFRSGRIFCLIIVSLFFSLSVFAQSTLFNAPSTDTVEEKFTYIEADYITHFGSFEKGGFRSGGYRMVYGARKNLEVGVNFFHTQSEGVQTTELQPNIKWRFYRNEKYKFAASGGAMVFVPLNRQSGKRAPTIFYANFSKEINVAGGARITTGAYKFVGVERDFGARSGAIVGLEKPVSKRLTFVADWFSGKNRLGYSAAGFNYKINNKHSLFSGYNFGNTGRANNALSVFYGYTF